MCDKAKHFVRLGPLLVVAGCCDVLIQGESGTIPTEIEMVRASKNDFAQSEDQPLAMVSAGTVMDDLANLDGCWAAYESHEVIGDELLTEVEIFAFYRIDLQAETLVHQILITWTDLDTGETGAAGPEVASVSSGSLEIVAPNKMIESWKHLFSLNVETGATFGWTPCGALVSNDLVTVSGDEMKIGSSSAEDGDGGLPEMVFTRFECP